VAVTKRERLIADGYELYTSLRVGVPHFVWTCSIDLIHDRNVSLIEETLLRLVDAGLGDRQDLTIATGLDNVVSANAIASMLEQSALEYDQDRRLRLSAVGKRMLLNAKARVQSTVEDVVVRHNPYGDNLSWHTPKFDLSPQQLKAAGRHRLSGVRPLNESEFQSRYQEIQSLIQHNGLPKEKRTFAGKVEVLRVNPTAMQVVFRPMDLDVWFKREGHVFDWVLLRDGVEEPEAIQVFERAQADGVEIIPLDSPLPELTVPPSNEAIHELATGLVSQAPTSDVLSTYELRDALRGAFEDAQSVLHIISPWLNQSAIDAEMTRWIETALSKKPGLRIIIGYGIEQLPTVPRDAKDYRTHRALQHLKSISARHGNRLILHEIGNTHEKVVVVDTKYAYIGSFNWLSFNPKLEKSKGVRREIGVRVREPLVVQGILERLRPSLEAAKVASLA
jgi:hypothetical protein